ncbi:MAG: DUF4065 domain-containing protein [Patescibacteria group bacterium]|nr:DUF4065 domain-containing protein [Patescibacteria group bacterium]
MKDRAILIAKYFIFKNAKDKRNLTNKKLQKLLYYAQAWNLVFNNKKLFNNEIEAWIHGPAVRSIYTRYKVFGFNNIEDKIDENEFKNLTKDELRVLDTVWEVYGKYDAGYLEELTHSEEPWIKTRNNLLPYEGSTRVIPTALMKAYYGRQIPK